LLALTVLAALPPAPVVGGGTTEAAETPANDAVQLAGLSESQASTAAQRALIDALAQQLADALHARNALAASRPPGDPDVREADETVRTFLFAVHAAATGAD